MSAASFPVRRAGRPRRDEVDQIDDRILAVARNSFLKQGFARTTIEKVAAESGTTRRSVMHRFADKDALLFAVGDRASAAQVGTILAAGPDVGDALGQLRAICRALLAMATDPEEFGLFRVYLGELGRFPLLSELLIRRNNDLEAGIERIVMQVQESGKFQNYSAAAVATSAIGMMLSNPINRAMMGDPQFHDPHRIDLYFSQMWAIFLLMS